MNNHPWVAHYDEGVPANINKTLATVECANAITKQVDETAKQIATPIPGNPDKKNECRSGVDPPIHPRSATTASGVT